VRDFIERMSGKLGRRETPRSEPGAPVVTKDQRRDAIRNQRKRGKVVTVRFHLTQRALTILVSNGHIHPGGLGDRVALSAALLDYLDWCIGKLS
jgi:hypothetical protein